MGWRLAKSLEKLREQINAAYPGRDKASDGSIGNAEHSARKSDHNPNSAGVVCATDTDEDLSPSIHSIESIVSAIRASRDPRVKYIIYERRITIQGSNLQQWKPYTAGKNPHNHHAHISVVSDPALYDDRSDWDIGDGTFPEIPERSPVTVNTVRDLKLGDSGDDVKVVQRILQLNSDGQFGKHTYRAVKVFQSQRGLKVDGIVGVGTRRALGL